MNDLKHAQILAVALWEKHYRNDAPSWQPLDTVSGVLNQIDNMTSGMVRSDELMQLRIMNDQLRATISGPIGSNKTYAQNCDPKDDKPKLN